MLAAMREPREGAGRAASAVQQAPFDGGPTADGVPVLSFDRALAHTGIRIEVDYARLTRAIAHLGLAPQDAADTCIHFRPPRRRRGRWGFTVNPRAFRRLPFVRSLVLRRAGLEPHQRAYRHQVVVFVARTETLERALRAHVHGRLSMPRAMVEQSTLSAGNAVASFIAHELRHVFQFASDLLAARSRQRARRLGHLALYGAGANALIVSGWDLVQGLPGGGIYPGGASLHLAVALTGGLVARHSLTRYRRIDVRERDADDYVRGCFRRNLSNPWLDVVRIEPRGAAAHEPAAALAPPTPSELGS